jgi:hypothetical protein
MTCKFISESWIVRDVFRRTRDPENRVISFMVQTFVLEWPVRGSHVDYKADVHRKRISKPSTAIG